MTYPNCYCVFSWKHLTFLELLFSNLWWAAGLPHKKSQEETCPENLLNHYLGYTVHYIKFLSNLPTLLVYNAALNLVLFVVLF